MQRRYEGDESKFGDESMSLPQNLSKLFHLFTIYGGQIEFEFRKDETFSEDLNDTIDYYNRCIDRYRDRYDWHYPFWYYRERHHDWRWYRHWRDYRRYYDRYGDWHYHHWYSPIEFHKLLHKIYLHGHDNPNFIEKNGKLYNYEIDRIIIEFSLIVMGIEEDLGSRLDQELSLRLRLEQLLPQLQLGLEQLPPQLQLGLEQLPQRLHLELEQLLSRLRLKLVELLRRLQLSPLQPSPQMGSPDPQKRPRKLQEINVADINAITVALKQGDQEAIKARLTENTLLATSKELFLLFVSAGEQSRVEAMLERNPQLAETRSIVTDLAGNTFEDITAFQYAIWALDYHMWTMILKYLSKKEQTLQLQDLETNGTEHGTYFNFDTLINALEMYVENYDQWSSEKCKTFWCENVGGAQLKLPAHVINEYCRLDRSFDPTPTFLDTHLPRSMRTDKGFWFTAQCNGGSLGVKFAVRRSHVWKKWGLDDGVESMAYRSWPWGAGSEYAYSDLQAIRALQETRLQQLKELKSTYSSINQNAVPTFSGSSSSSSWSSSSRGSAISSRSSDFLEDSKEIVRELHHESVSSGNSDVRSPLLSRSLFAKNEKTQIQKQGSGFKEDNEKNKKSRSLSPQTYTKDDTIIAWMLQIQEFSRDELSSPKLSFSSRSSSSQERPYHFFNENGEREEAALRGTIPDGDCFFTSVNRPNLTRENLVQALLKKSDVEAVRKGFVLEIFQFLMLGYTGMAGPNPRENKACQALLTPYVRGLFKELDSCNDNLKKQITTAREILEIDTRGMLPSQLSNALLEKIGRNALWEEFNEAHKKCITAERAIRLYCQTPATFQSYVKLYLEEARGYIPFARDLQGEGEYSTPIDVISDLFNLNIQVYSPKSPGSFELMRLMKGNREGELVAIFHDGHNHFEGLTLQSVVAQERLHFQYNRG